LLFIDEPTTNLSGTSGPGPASAFNFCGNSLTGAGPGGCTQAVQASGQSGTCTTFISSGVCTAFTAAANAFMGVVSANQVAFNGVPVNPPVSTGVARVYRITNVRANVSALGGGGLAGTTQLLASISISGSTSLPVNNPVQVAGLIQQGLTTSLRNTANSGGGGNSNLNQCGGGGPNPLQILRYSENFPSAFKTRVAPLSATNYSGQLTNPTGQSTPGTIYPSESGLIVTTPASGSTPAGLADYGTRLKAVFNNVPAGVRIFVSTTNVLNDFAANPTQPAGNSNTGFAQLVLSETAPDANGFPPVASATSTITFGSLTLNIVEIPVVGGTATAVWEVINTNPNALDSLDFGVYQSFTANPGANSPPPGTGTVNMSYAPTPPTAFTASQGGTASLALTVPRFADTSSGNNVLSIVLCQTTLLYPFVTNQAGFDTGIAIANTTSDPFGTRTQNGTCVMNWYGASAPAAVTTPSVATGTVYTTLASTSAAGFQGYMIAVCNFQLAHGFAFISDLGARNLAMGYLALVVQTGTGNRNSGSLPTGLSSSVEVLGN